MFFETSHMLSETSHTLLQNQKNLRGRCPHTPTSTASPECVIGTKGVPNALKFCRGRELCDGITSAIRQSPQMCSDPLFTATAESTHMVTGSRTSRSWYGIPRRMDPRVDGRTGAHRPLSLEGPRRPTTGLHIGARWGKRSAAVDEIRSCCRVTFKSGGK